MAVNVDEIITQLSGMSVLDLVKLSKALQEQWGVSAAPVAVAGAAPAATGPAEAAPVAEEQTEFSVVLTDVGPNKINIIKEVRALKSGLGLKEAKELVDSAPVSILDGVTKDEANAAKTRLEEAGAKVDVK
jgi:large subunit ribosomal protein L7/L12